MKQSRIAALVLALMMLLTMLPVPVSAADHTHRWVKRSSKEATCTKDGSVTYVCSCGEKKTEIIPAKGHKWGKWTVIKKSTCSASGKRKHTCSVCDTTEYEDMKKEPHEWSEWEILEEATDHSIGRRAHECQVCWTRNEEDYYPDGTLLPGEKGDGVKALQEVLICYGVYKHKASGNYNKATENAVKAVQTAEGLEPDGIAWPQTQAVLSHVFGEWEVVSELSEFSKFLRRRTCSRCGYVESEEEWPVPTYQRGDKGDGVKDLQQKLNEDGYNAGKADGTFGGKTVQAVKALEKAHGVEADGIAWPGVQKWLNGGEYAWQPTGDDGSDDDKDGPEEPDKPEESEEHGGEDSPANGFGPDSDAEKPEDILSLIKIVTNTFDADPNGFVEGETIDYMIIAINRTDEPLGQVKIYDPLKGEDMLVDSVLLDEYETETAFFEYTVTKDDIGDLITNTATAVWEYKGNPMEVQSNTVAVPTVGDAPVTVLKSVENLPECGFFAEDEVVDFLITVVNNKDSDISDVIVSDSLSDTPGHVIDSFSSVPAGGTETTHMLYTVKHEDVDGGWLTNTASVQYAKAKKLPSVTIQVPLGEHPSDVTPEPDPRPEPETEPQPTPTPAPKSQATCMPELIGTGKNIAHWKLTRCPEHEKVAAAANKLLSQAEGDAVWEGVEKLWNGALEAEYKAMIGKAKKNRTLRAAIEKEKKRFDSQLAAHRAALTLEYPDKPALVSRKISEILARRTVMLCYESHSAPNARKDLLSASGDVKFFLPETDICRQQTGDLTDTLYITDMICASHRKMEAMAAKAEDADSWKQVRQAWQDGLDRITERKYSAADKAGKAVVSEERISFGRWLEAREALLTLQYPAQDAVVQELMAQALRERVIDLCDGYEE